MKHVKKIALPLVFAILSSCAGMLWDGQPRAAEEDETITITIVIENPFWEYYYLLEAEKVRD